MQQEDPNKDIVDNYNNKIIMSSYLLLLNPNLVINMEKAKKDIMEFYKYSETNHYYEKQTHLEMRKRLSDIFIKNNITEKYTQRLMDEIIQATFNSSHLPKDYFNNYDNLIPLNNGILELPAPATIQNPTPIKTATLHNHDPKYRFTYCFDYDYDPKQTDFSIITKHIDKMFTDVQGNPDTEQLEIIQMLFGYFICPQVAPNITLEKVFMLLGNGANGKSLLIDIITLLFHSENISYLDLAMLSNKGYESSMLEKSRINITAEAKYEKLESERIKSIVSGEKILVTSKFIKDYEIKPRTKLIIASNTRPYFSDTSDGLVRRLYPIDFKNRFISQSEYALYKPEEARKQRLFLAGDKHSILKHITENRSTLLNYALIGLQKLSALDFKLPESNNTKITKGEYTRSMDTLKMWLTDTFKPANENENENAPSRELALDEIHEMYREWYRWNVKDTTVNLARETLGKRIRDIFRGINTRRARGKNKQFTTFYNLEFVDPLTSSETPLVNVTEQFPFNKSI